MPRASKAAPSGAIGSTAKPSASSRSRMRSSASAAASGSGTTRSSRGQRASASPTRRPGRTPAASAAGVQSPTAWAAPGAGPRATCASSGRRARSSATSSGRRGTWTATIIEHMFAHRADVIKTIRANLTDADLVGSPPMLQPAQAIWIAATTGLDLWRRRRRVVETGRRPGGVGEGAEMGRRTIGGRRWGTACLAALGLVAAAAGSVQAAPLPAAAASQIEAITNATPRYANSTWGIAIDDAVTGERVYARNAQQMFVPASITKLAQGAAALEAYGPDHRLRTPVHRIGRVAGGRLRGTLSLVAAGDFSFGLRDRKGGKLAYADGGADHNEANSLGLVKSVSGDPLKALDALARDVRRSGITRATDAVIDDRLWETQSLARRADHADLGQREPHRHHPAPDGARRARRATTGVPRPPPTGSCRRCGPAPRPRSTSTSRGPGSCA